MKTALLLVLAAVFLASPAWALKLGDKAPPVKAKIWLNGDAVNPAEPDGQTIYVVEFWATWCPPCRKSIPHLNQLQAKLKDQSVVIIGVTNEAEEKVRPFAEKMKMAYRVAIDPKRETYGPYMKEVRGIPHAFVVDPQGLIVWAGHPMDGLDEALDQILAGTYDLEKTRSLEKLEDELQGLVTSGEYGQALTKVDELIAAAGPKIDYFQMKLGLLAQSDQQDRFSEVYRSMYEAFRDSADELNTLAWLTCTSPFEYCDLEISWNAAQRAVELVERKNAAHLDTLARVHYALGLLEPAVAIQSEAVEKSSDAEAAGYRKTLDYYRAALEIRQRVTSAAPSDPET